MTDKRIDTTINIHIPDLSKHQDNIDNFFKYHIESLDSQIANINIRTAESNRMLGKE